MFTIQQMKLSDNKADLHHRLTSYLHTEEEDE